MSQIEYKIGNVVRRTGDSMTGSLTVPYLNTTGDLAVGGNISVTGSSTINVNETVTGNLLVNGSITSSGANAQLAIHNSSTASLINASGLAVNINGLLYSNSIIKTTGQANAPATGFGPEMLTDGATSFFLGYNRGTSVYTLVNLDGTNVDIRGVTGSVSFFTNNIKRGSIDVNGNFGINTNSPLAQLHVSGITQAQSFRVDASGASNALTVISGGNVGINDTTYSQRLTVGGNISGTNIYAQTNVNANNIVASNISGLNISGGTLTVNGLYASGNCGIGTAAPVSKLNISDGATPAAAVTGEMLQVVRSTTNGLASAATRIQIGNASNSFGIAYGGTTDRLGFIDGGAIEVMSLKNGGNVGIGISSPSAQLTLSGNALPFVVHGTNQANALFVSGNGKISVGNSTPDAQFHIGDANTKIVMGGSYTGTGWTGDRAAMLLYTGTGKGQFSVINNSDTLIGAESNNGLQILTNNTARMNIGSQGNISMSGGTIPLTIHGTGQANILFVSGNGKIGINNATPNANIDISFSSNSTAGSLHSIGWRFISNGVKYWGIRNDDSPNFYLDRYNGTSWSENIKIAQDSGNMGLNTTNPLGLLHIGSSTTSLRVDASGTKATTAAVLTVPVTIATYGTTGSLLGDPASWLNISVSGIAYKLPLYT